MKIMSKRFLSFLLVCVLLCALLPWSALPVHAEFGPGYSARTVQAYQYLAGRIQANGTYNSVLNSYQWKKTIPNGVTFSMQLDKENGDDLSFVLELNEEVWYTPEDEEYDSVCEEQTVGIYTLVLDNGYWQYNEYWVDNYRYVSGYLMYHPRLHRSSADLLRAGRPCAVFVFWARWGYRSSKERSCARDQ